MERTFSPMIRQYSAIDGLQQAYTLVYAMEVEGTQGCRLTLCQIGSRQQIVSQHVAAAPEFCYRLLRYLHVGLGIIVVNFLVKNYLLAAKGIDILEQLPGW